MIEAARVVVVQKSARACARCLRLKPALGEETVAVGVARVVLRTVTAPAVRVEAELFGPNRVHLRKARTGAFPIVACRLARAEIFHDDAASADLVDDGHAQQ